MTKVAINGLGRIGRAAFKIIQDTPSLELVAVNDIAPLEGIIYLLKYDTVYGRYEKPVRSDGGELVVGETRLHFLGEKDPALLPWGDLGVDIVFECTGVFLRKPDLMKHLDAGAKRVILSAPTKGGEVPTVVYGVNEVDADTQFISCASCTTNCITPVIEVVGRRIGIEKAVMTAIHAYTASQSLVDSPQATMRRGRAGAANLVPTSTGAAIATTRALPQYEGRFDGAAVRAPITVGSISDITLLTSRRTSTEEINAIFEEEAGTERYAEVLGVQHDPVVSSDIIGDTRASVIDAAMTQVVDGDLVKIMSWYDNEWGYVSQMVRQAQHMAERTPALSV